MKKLITLLALSLLAALAGVSFADDAAVDVPKAAYVTDFAQAKELATAGNKPIVVDFYTDWCTWCKKFDKEVLTDQKAIDFLGNEVVFAKINAEVDTNVSKAYKIMGFPTFLLTDANGHEIERIAGYLATDDFIKTVNDYRNGIGTLGALLEKSKEGQNRSLYFEIADKYKYRGDTKSAKEWYDKIVATGEKKDSLTGESYMAIGDMYRRDKQNEQAMAVYQQVVQEFAGTPFEGQGMLFVGHTHRRLNEFDKALAIYNEVMAKYKGATFEQEGEIYRAIAYRDMGDTTQAISSFVSFLEHWPKSEDVEYANEQIKKLRGE